MPLLYSRRLQSPTRVLSQAPARLAIARSTTPSATTFHPALRAKLRLGAPDDKYEREADRLADQVMREPRRVPEAPLNSPDGPRAVRRKCVACTSSDTGLCPECEEELQRQALPLMQRKPAGAVQSVPPIVNDVLSSNGQPLEAATRAFFEGRFGHDFSATRVHTDARAAESARAVEARAYTVGPHVVFGTGEYTLETPTGMRLLAHELAHVVQQEEAQPRMQRLAIKQKNLSKGTCGTYDVSWEFVLDNAATEAGFIVQQIDRNEWLEACGAQGAPTPLRTYWEAWEVEANRKRSPDTIANGFTDVSAFEGQPGTWGDVSSTGTAKFFPMSITGNLNSLWKAREGGWGCLYPPVGEVPESGDAPSTYTKPTWWDSPPVEGPEQRSVSASWSCCDADKAKHATEVDAHP